MGEPLMWGKAPTLSCEQVMGWNVLRYLADSDRPAALAIDADGHDAGHQSSEQGS